MGKMTEIILIVIVLLFILIEINLGFYFLNSIQTLNKKSEACWRRTSDQKRKS